jgi:hypothetical protein
MRRIGETCTAAQTRMRCERIAARKYDRNGAESGSDVAFSSEWRPLLRSDRLLGLPAADRQNLGCSPAIEGPSPRYPPKDARFSGHMSGSRRKPLIATNWESSRQTARERGKRARNRCIWSTKPRLAVSARGVGPDGSRQLPAESGCRQREKGKGHEATRAWGIAGRIAEPGHTWGPRRNRPSRTAGPCLPRRSPRNEIEKKRGVSVTPGTFAHWHGHLKQGHDTVTAE